jgi:hypothetical protein
MTKSSYGLVLLFAGWGVAGEAAPPPGAYLTAEEAMKHYHETFGVPPARGCDDADRGSGEDIVVCGSLPRRYRLPLPIEREPGEIVRHVNEPEATTAALAGAACTHSCYQPVTINVIKAARAVPKIISHILGHDD